MMGIANHSYCPVRQSAKIFSLVKKAGLFPAFMPSATAFAANFIGSVAVRFANCAAADRNEFKELVYVATSI